MTSVTSVEENYFDRYVNLSSAKDKGLGDKSSNTFPRRKKNFRSKGKKFEMSKGKQHKKRTNAKEK